MRRTSFIGRGCLVAAITFIAACSDAAAQRVNEKPPALANLKWYKGREGSTQRPDDGLQVVEFVSVACPFSADRVTAFDELRHTFANKPVVLTLVFLDDHDQVRDYCEQTRIEPKHPVACSGQLCAAFWLGPVQAMGVPYSFVVGKEGKVIWHGPPANGMRGVIDAALSGSYTLQTALKVKDLANGLGIMLEAEQWDKSVETIDRLIELDPNPFIYHALKFEVLAAGKGDPAAAKRCGKKLLAGMSADEMDEFARYLVGGELGSDFYDLALTFAEAAHKKAGGERKDLAHQLAKVRYLNGDIKGAIEMEKVALKLAGGQGDTLFRITLQKYEKAAEERKP